MSIFFINVLSVLKVHCDTPNKIQQVKDYAMEEINTTRNPKPEVGRVAKNCSQVKVEYFNIFFLE